MIDGMSQNSDGKEKVLHKENTDCLLSVMMESVVP